MSDQEHPGRPDDREAAAEESPTAQESPAEEADAAAGSGAGDGGTGS